MGGYNRFYVRRRTVQAEEKKLWKAAAAPKQAAIEYKPSNSAEYYSSDYNRNQSSQNNNANPGNNPSGGSNRFNQNSNNQGGNESGYNRNNGPNSNWRSRDRPQDGNRAGAVPCD